MHAILIEGPAVEPVGLEEMREHLRLDDEWQDATLVGLITAARMAVESSARRVLIAQRWQVVHEGWPCANVLRLPLSPIHAVDRVAIVEEIGEEHELPLASYALDGASDPPRIVFTQEALALAFPACRIVVTCRAGYGETPETVPEPLRLSIRLLVSRWFEDRGDARGEAFPLEVLSLVAPYRDARL